LGKNRRRPRCVACETELDSIGTLAGPCIGFVSDSVWLQELNYLERDMVERINAHLGRKAVKKIEFRMG